MSEKLDEGDQHELASSLRVVIGRLRRRLREGGSLGDFTPSQITVLSHLERHGPSTITVLARAEGVRPQSMVPSVAALEAAGFVAGEPDPADGRQTILSLTPLARAEVASGRAAREDWLFRAITSTLTDAEQEQLLGAVPLLQRIANS